MFHLILFVCLFSNYFHLLFRFVTAISTGLLLLLYTTKQNPINVSVFEVTIEWTEFRWHEKNIVSEIEMHICKLLVLFMTLNNPNIGRILMILYIDLRRKVTCILNFVEIFLFGKLFEKYISKFSSISQLLSLFPTHTLSYVHSTDYLPLYVQFCIMHRICIGVFLWVWVFVFCLIWPLYFIATNL